MRFRTVNLPFQFLKRVEQPALARRRPAGLLAVSALALLGLAGCHTDMWVQPKVKPQHQSDFFPDQQANRPLLPHTVDRDHYWTDSERYTGYDNKDQIATTFPFKITRKDIERGQERFNIYCSPCHGALGNGQGMIAQRGFALRRQPGNYHTDKLRKMPVGHFYDVITNGFGTMYSYASRVEPDDRWRIAAYIRVLQRSQNAAREDVNERDPRLTPGAKKQIESFTPPVGAGNNPGLPGGTDANRPNGEAPRPLSDTPVPNTGQPNNMTPTGAPGAGNAAPGTGGGNTMPGGTGNNTPLPGETGTGTIRHAPAPSPGPLNPPGPNGPAGGPRPPTTNGITPPAGGTSGSSR